MQALRGQIGRLHIIAFSAVGVLTVVLIAAASATNGYLTTAMNGQDARLQAISARAERIQMFARHIRNASLTSGEAEVDLQFGGFVGAASQLEPGGRVKLPYADGVDHTVEIISVNKVPSAFRTFGLGAEQAQPVELYIISGRALSSRNDQIVRLLVTAAPDKPMTTSIVEQRTL